MSLAFVVSGSNNAPLTLVSVEVRMLLTLVSVVAAMIQTTVSVGVVKNELKVHGKTLSN